VLCPVYPAGEKIDYNFLDVIYKSESLKYEAIRDYTTNLTYTSPLYEQPLLKKDGDLADKRDTWHKSLKKDIYKLSDNNIDRLLDEVQKMLNGFIQKLKANS